VGVAAGVGVEIGADAVAGTATGGGLEDDAETPVTAAIAAATRSLGISRIFVSRSSPSISMGTRGRLALTGGVEALAPALRSGEGGAEERPTAGAAAGDGLLPGAGVVRRVGDSIVARVGDDGGTIDGGRTLGDGAAFAAACPGSVGRAAIGGGITCAAVGRADAGTCALDGGGG
jgi:hypothetical protein